MGQSKAMRVDGITYQPHDDGSLTIIIDGLKPMLITTIAGLRRAFKYATRVSD